MDVKFEFNLVYDVQKFLKEYIFTAFTLPYLTAASISKNTDEVSSIFLKATSTQDIDYPQDTKVKT